MAIESIDDRKIVLRERPAAAVKSLRSCDPIVDVFSGTLCCQVEEMDQTQRSVLSGDGKLAQLECETRLVHCAYSIWISSDIKRYFSYRWDSRSKGSVGLCVVNADHLTFAIITPEEVVHVIERDTIVFAEQVGSGMSFTNTVLTVHHQRTIIACCGIGYDSNDLPRCGHDSRRQAPVIENSSNGKGRKFVSSIRSYHFSEVTRRFSVVNCLPRINKTFVYTQEGVVS